MKRIFALAAEHKDGLCIATKEMGGKGLEKQFGKVNTWLKGIGY